MNIIPLEMTGEGHLVIPFGHVSLEFVTRFNYSIPAWSLDIKNAVGELLVAGVILLPGVDILKASPEIKAITGTLQVTEKNADDYKNPFLLGTNVQLVVM